MSALGQKQTYAVHNGASALPPKATSNGPSGRQFKPPHTLPIVFPAHNSGKIVFEKRPIYLAKMNAAAPSTSVAQFDIGLFDDLAEFRALGLHEGLELGNLHRLWHNTLRQHLVGNRWVDERRIDDAVEAFDDL